MKTVILKFEYFLNKKIKTNEAIVKITPPEGEIPTIIHEITFRDPVKTFTYNQIFDLNKQLENVCMEEENQFKNNGVLTVGQAGAALMKGPRGINQIFENARGLINSGKLNKEDKEIGDGIMNLFDRLMNPGKNKK